jgi:hypothetical protein
VASPQALPVWGARGSHHSPLDPSHPNAEINFEWFLGCDQTSLPTRSSTRRVHSPVPGTGDSYAHHRSGHAVFRDYMPKNSTPLAPSRGAFHFSTFSAKCQIPTQPAKLAGPFSKRLQT